MISWGNQQQCGEAVLPSLLGCCWWTVCLDCAPEIEKWWWPEGSCQSELAIAAGANRCECVAVSVSLAELYGNTRAQQLQGQNMCLCVSSWWGGGIILWGRKPCIPPVIFSVSVSAAAPLGFNYGLEDVNVQPGSPKALLLDYCVTLGPDLLRMFHKTDIFLLRLRSLKECLYPAEFYY